MKTVEYGTENRDVVMLLHGGGLSWWNYREEAEKLGESFHVVLPILDGHAGSGAAFSGIRENAQRILSHIDREYGGSVLLIGGLSLGAQVLVEMLSIRGDIAHYAIVESASVIPSRITGALIGPAVSSSYGLIRQKWFARLQMRYLRIPFGLFEDYYRDTKAISKRDMAAFLKASAEYGMKKELRGCRANVRIAVGERESSGMLRSARLLHGAIPHSSLEVLKGLRHGEYSLNCPRRYAADLLEMLGKRADGAFFEGPPA